jgi:phosphodiesterase/alkaline phosphatase D-like protein
METMRRDVHGDGRRAARRAGLASMNAMRLAAAVLALAAAGCHKKGDDASWTYGFPAGVAAGEVTQKSAVIWSMNTAPTFLSVTWSTDPTLTTASGGATAFVPVPGATAKVSITGLQPGTLYYYRVVDEAGNSAVGRFRTLFDENVSRGLRFGAAGSRSAGLVPCQAAANVPDRCLDFFALLGDVIDADASSPVAPDAPAAGVDGYRARYVETFAARPGAFTLADLRASCAVLAGPGDRNIWARVAGGAFLALDPRYTGMAGDCVNDTPLFHDALQAFVEFAPIEDRSWSGTKDPRVDGHRQVYRVTGYGRLAAVFLLDTRSFRDPNLAPAANPFYPVDAEAFRNAALAPGRTMLGAGQLETLKGDLRTAHRAGVWWKFILLHDPVQNLGARGGEDRFEGFAAERADLLRFIREEDIRNVVFVSSDVRGMLVNDLSYEPSEGAAPVPSGAFEVCTGPIASAPLFGPDLVVAARAAGAVTDAQAAAYDAMPVPEKDAFVRDLIDCQIVPLGYDPLGLEGSSIDATLIEGRYVAMHAFGWTEFEINPSTHNLTVTAYGIEPYSEADLAADPEGVAARAPAILCRFQVVPKYVAQPPSDGGGNPPSQCWVAAGRPVTSGFVVVLGLAGFALVWCVGRARRVA